MGLLSCLGRRPIRRRDRSLPSQSVDGDQTVPQGVHGDVWRKGVPEPVGQDRSREEDPGEGPEEHWVPWDCHLGGRTARGLDTNRGAQLGGPQNQEATSAGYTDSLSGLVIGGSFDGAISSVTVFDGTVNNTDARTVTPIDGQDVCRAVFRSIGVSRGRGELSRLGRYEYVDAADRHSCPTTFTPASTTLITPSPPNRLTILILLLSTWRRNAKFILNLHTGGLHQLARRRSSCEPLQLRARARCPDGRTHWRQSRPVKETRWTKVSQNDV